VPVRVPPVPPAAKPAAPANVPQIARLSDLPAPVEVKPAVVMLPQEPIPPEPEPDPDPDPYAHLPLLRQLPFEVQTAIPDLRITVHVYGEEPRSRFVMIQRKKYREGDRLSDDLTLDAIAPGGLVLRYQDTAFWMDSH
jgi:general secretion pathway protein B